MGLFAAKESQLGAKMCNGRWDFNDIKDHVEKKGGNRRQEISFWGFRNFIADMEMEEVKFKGEVLHGLITEKTRFYRRTARYIFWINGVDA